MRYFRSKITLKSGKVLHKNHETNGTDIDVRKYLLGRYPSATAYELEELNLSETKTVGSHRYVNDPRFREQVREPEVEEEPTASEDSAVALRSAEQTAAKKLKLVTDEEAQKDQRFASGPQQPKPISGQKSPITVDGTTSAGKTDGGSKK